MVNDWPKGANLVSASAILSVQMAGLPLAPVQSGPSYFGPRMTLDEQTKAHIVAFVQRFVAASQSDNLSSLTTFYGPNVRFNGNPITREALRQQVENALRTFPQRSWQFISGPTVTPASDPLFAFADLWEGRKPPENGEWVRTCKIITGEPMSAQKDEAVSGIFYQSV